MPAAYGAEVKGCMQSIEYVILRSVSINDQPSMRFHRKLPPPPGAKGSYAADGYLVTDTGIRHQPLHFQPSSITIKSPNPPCAVEASHNAYDDAAADWQPDDTFDWIDTHDSFASDRYCHLLTESEASPIVGVSHGGRQATFLVRRFDEQKQQLSREANFTTFQLCNFSCGQKAVVSWCSCTEEGLAVGKCSLLHANRLSFTKYGQLIPI